MAPKPGDDGRRGRYLQRNDTTWSPGSVVCVDSEAWRHDRGDGEDQTLRLWCARLDDRRARKRGAVEHQAATGTTGQQLAAQIDGWSVQRPALWLYAHNLGYDLPLTGLIGELAALGWMVSWSSSTPHYLFLTLVKRGRTLTVTDSHHLLPMRLEDIGGLLGLAKLPMPAAGAPEADWVTYCARDTDVLAEAVLALMDHWDGYGLGRWTVSGAACGFRAMRHMMPPKVITLFDDPEGSSNDRAAIYGGRRYCWRWGDQPPGRYTELDFTAAHATTAANYPLPAKRGPWVDTLDPYHKVIDGQYGYFIGEVEVETDVPRWPVRDGGQVRYPVGRFVTTLASPDIAWARDLGCLRRIGRGQIHYHTMALAPFFQRVLGIQDASDEAVPPVAKAMWRQWGRSVIGKFAQQGYQVEDTPMLTDKPWHYEAEIDAQTGEQGWLVHYAGTIHRARQHGDGPNAYPAVLAIVESYERVAIGKAAEMLGPDVVVQCDTDGLWADTGALDAGAGTGLGFALGEIDRTIRVQLAVDVISQQTGALQLREKHHVNRMVIAGPQNYTAGPHTRQSGRPGRLTEVAPGEFTGDIFPHIGHQMRCAGPGVFRTETITWTVPRCVIPGWCLPGGRVVPLEMTTGPGGGNRMLTWAQSRHARGGARLAALQNPNLAGLHNPAADCEEDTDGKHPVWDRSTEEARAVVSARRRSLGLPPARQGVSRVRARERETPLDVWRGVVADPWGDRNGERPP